MQYCAFVCEQKTIDTLVLASDSMGAEHGVQPSDVRGVMGKQKHSDKDIFNPKLNYYELSDAACKAFLSDKLILACILKDCTEEFKDCHVHDIETLYIEGEPEISTVGVHPDTTNMRDCGERVSRIHGIHAESTSDTEGTVTYDIRFYALTPTQERVKLIINIEAQNAFYPGYPLIKRGIYYGCRQVSAQYGSEFNHAHYEHIKKVYSIWICFAPPKNRRNTVTMYHINEKQLIGDVHEDVAHYDLMTVVMICLGNPNDGRYTGILKLLGTFMSQGTDSATKNDVLKSEFGAEIPERLHDREDIMCTYSQFIEDRGRAEGMAKGKAEDLLSLMANFKMTLEQAMQGLNIPEVEWPKYRELVQEMQTQTAQA